MPALCPIIARAGAFFKKGKVQTMKEKEMDSFIIQALDNAIENLNDKTKAEALRLARAYFGESTTERSPSFTFVSGFLIGMGEGMKIADIIDAAAAEQTAR